VNLLKKNTPASTIATLEAVDKRFEMTK